MRGELDWIVMKALEKDRTRRYGDGQRARRRISKDIGYNEPVLASPLSTMVLRGEARTTKPAPWLRQQRRWPPLMSALGGNYVLSRRDESRQAVTVPIRRRDG